VKGLIIRFALTDINVRRLYVRLAITQAGRSNECVVDLTSFFWIGPTGVPSFGTASEIILPWDGGLHSQLKLDFTLPQTPGQPAQHIPEHNPWFAPRPVNPMQDYLNQISYAVFQITGFIY
jgi:hypothetical protein